jgi:hypothetical protein
VPGVENDVEYEPETKAPETDDHDGFPFVEA